MTDKEQLQVQGNAHILVVDDTPQNIAIVTRFLKKDAYQVSSAADGETALRLVTETKFDLILLDVMMPRLDGFEVCRRLRDSPLTTETPVVFLTARTDSQGVLEGFQAGGVDFINKPFNGAELLARVRTHISLRRSRDILRQREAILSGVSYAAEHFLKTHDWRARIQQVLQRLAEASEASLVYLCECASRDDNALEKIAVPYCSCSNMPQQCQREHNNCRHFLNLLADEYLRRGRLVRGVRTDFASPLSDWLAEHHVEALLIAPIFVNQEWWGALIVEEQREARRWPDATVAALETAAAILSAAIERSQTEQALWQSREWMRTLLDNVDDLVCFRDLQGRPSNCNPAYTHLTGYSSEEFNQQDQLWFSLLHPDEKAEILASFAQHPQGTSLLEIEYRLRDRENEWRWLHARMVGMLDEQGRYTGYHCIERDITHRKRVTEDRLRQAAIVFENTAEAIVVADARSNINAVNRAFTEITGYQELEVLGQNPRLLKSGRHDQEFYDCLWQKVRQTGFWQGEIWNRRKDGDIFPAWQNITAVTDENDDVVHYVSIFTDITERKISEERIRHLAHHDALTDLPNRLLFNERVEHGLQRASQHNKQLALMFFDLDHFKNVNDSLGHATGDQLLKEVAQRLLACVRKEDTVARLGGDEFIILLEDITETKEPAHIASEIRSLFQTPFQIGGHALYLTPSIGISLYPQDGDDTDTLVRNADAAMYRAKERGRNAYEFYTEELTNSALERIQLEEHLRTALQNQELSLYYQPQICLRSGRIVGAEALMRWHHPELGNVPPSKFIPLAEETGLIFSLGEWSLHTACAQVRAWQEQGLSIDHVAVNLSALQVQRGKLTELVKKVLAETQLPAPCLELEITESVIMEDPLQAAEIFENLRQQGVTLAIDDFGTGYSSLAYLRRLPIYKLKIDQSFVQDITRDPHCETIARAVIALGKSLQLNIIAEGIEDTEQQRILQAENCDQAQGYLYSRPLPPAAFAALLQDKDKQRGWSR